NHPKRTAHIITEQAEPDTATGNKQPEIAGRKAQYHDAGWYCGTHHGDWLRLAVLYPLPAEAGGPATSRDHPPAGYSHTGHYICRGTRAQTHSRRPARWGRPAI